jgi:hypothetical protein
MTKFEQRYIGDDQRENVVQDALKLLHANRANTLNAAGYPLTMTDDEFVERIAALFEKDRSRAKVFRNDTYQVAVYHDPPPAATWPPLVHLSIKRIDRQPIHDWRELQAIKNELVGPEAEAVELYPAQSRAVDTANQYHLWVLGNGASWPFGFPKGLVADSIEGTTAQQRPL